MVEFVFVCVCVCFPVEIESSITRTKENLKQKPSNWEGWRNFKEGVDGWKWRNSVNSRVLWTRRWRWSGGVYWIRRREEGHWIGKQWVRTFNFMAVHKSEFMCEWVGLCPTKSSTLNLTTKRMLWAKTNLLWLAFSQIGI